MDFNKLKEQASSFMNQQNDSSNQGSADSNMSTNTGDMSNTGSINMGSNTTSTGNSNEDYGDKGSHPLSPLPLHCPSSHRITTNTSPLYRSRFSREENRTYSQP